MRQDGVGSAVQAAGGFGNGAGAADVDDVDLLRAAEYGLIATLLRSPPDRAVLDRVAALQGDATPLGRAHAALAQAAVAAGPEELEKEFFTLFVGLGRGELLPYASYYLTGFLHERPLGRVRTDLAALGIERASNVREPEDHIAMLCEVMAGLAAARFGAGPGADRYFFERHLEPWAPRFFADLEATASARFYRAVGALGRRFIAVEAEAFAMSGPPPHRSASPLAEARGALAEGRDS